MRYAVLDVETANPRFSSICQIGVAIFENRQYVDGITLLVNPFDYFHPINVGIHGITAEQVADAPNFRSAWVDARSFIGDRIVVHHTPFDRSAVAAALALPSPPQDIQWLDSASVVRRVWPEFSAIGYGLANLARHFDIQFGHHNALEDARAAGVVLSICLNQSQTLVGDWPTKVRRRASRSSFTSDGSDFGQLAGEQIVFTGTLSQTRDAWSRLVASHGAAVANSVSQKTTIVVVGEQDVSKLAGKEKSAKHLKAEELAQGGHEIRIICEPDLEALLAD